MNMEQPIKIIETDPEKFLEDLACRKAEDLDLVTEQVAEIIREVRARGDQALSDFSRRFDYLELAPEDFRVVSVRSRWSKEDPAWPLPAAAQAAAWPHWIPVPTKV